MMIVSDIRATNFCTKFSKKSYIILVISLSYLVVPFRVSQPVAKATYLSLPPPTRLYLKYIYCKEIGVFRIDIVVVLSP